MTKPRKLSIVNMKVLKQLIKLILFSLLVQARRARRTGTQLINKVKDRKLYCECGETIIKDGKNQWIQRLMGFNKPVDGKRLRCGYSINDMHSTKLVNTFENRKFKRKCVSKTGFCYSMEMKRKDGTHTSKIIVFVRSRPPRTKTSVYGRRWTDGRTFVRGGWSDLWIKNVPAPVVNYLTLSRLSDGHVQTVIQKIYHFIQLLMVVLKRTTCYWSKVEHLSMTRKMSVYRHNPTG